MSALGSTTRGKMSSYVLEMACQSAPNTETGDTKGHSIRHTGCIHLTFGLRDS